MNRGALGVKSPGDRLCRGYARASRLIHRITDDAARPEAQAREALAGVRRQGFPEMTRQRWRVSTQDRRLAWVFVIAFAGYTESPGDVDSC